MARGDHSDDTVMDLLDKIGRLRALDDDEQARWERSKALMLPADFTRKMRREAGLRG